MWTTKLSFSLRVALATVLFVVYGVFGVWRRSEGDHAGVAIAATLVWSILFATVSAAQHQCQRRFRWNDGLARYYSSASVALKRKAEASAALAESATGERARAYYRRRAERLPREAEKREALAACYEVKARWWNFLR